jgi:small conductance mechanosensitive channel
MILLENQYRVCNVVRIGDVSGVVEDITLRMTLLRDIEGVAHFIPHSQIKTVSNLTHQWSRAMIDVGVAYKEDVDRVIGVLEEVAAEMRRDPQHGPMILEDAEILGVDQLADSAVVIRMTVKTVPVRQWAVKRAFLRRIKKRFDELGIEIPFPHRTVYHRTAAPGGTPPPDPAEDRDGISPAPGRRLR